MVAEVSPDATERDVDLLVLGEVNADVIVSGDVDPAFGQEERIASEGAVVLGGAGAITACGAARLGLRVAYAGLAGDDALGRFCLDELAAAGVDVSAVHARSGVRSGLGVHLVRDDGDRAILSYLGAIPLFSVADVEPALLRRARHIHVGAYFLQTGLHPGLAGLLSSHRATGGTSSLDPNWDPSGAWSLGDVLSGLDYLLPNAAEAERLSGVAGSGAAARALSLRGPTVVIKLGADGALLDDGETATTLNVRPLEGYADAIGAGDTFDAGFLTASLGGASHLEALALGCACGALSLRATGGTASQPDRDAAEALAATLLEHAGTMTRMEAP
jgi:sugar/nucleoside kinase (ribokinase family)